MEPAINWALFDGLVSDTVGGGTGGAVKATGAAALLSGGFDVGVTSIRADGMMANVRSAKAMMKKKGVLFMRNPPGGKPRFIKL